MVAESKRWICLLVLCTAVDRGLTLRRFPGTEIKVGSGPNVCAAIIDRCRARCENADKNVGTEYVQMTIKLLNSATSCFTNVTEPGQLIPVNPSNPNHQIIVFTIPCCQQRHVNGSCPGLKDSSLTNRSLPTAGHRPIHDDQSIRLLNTPVPSVLSRSLVYSSTESTLPKDTNQLRTMEITDVVLLTFVILCFILITITLVILIRTRKKSRKEAVTASDSRMQNETDVIPPENIIVENGKCTWTKKEDTVIVGNGHFTEINRKESTTTSGSDISYSKMEDPPPASDYVVLPNQSFPPAPKSARPSRNRQAESSEEVIIVGAKNIVTPVAPGNHSNLQKWSHNVSTRDESMDLTKNQTNIEGLFDTKKHNADLPMYLKEINEISSGASATTSRLPSKSRLGRQSSSDSYEDPDFSRNRAQSEVNSSHWDTVTNDQDDNIYNTLRNNKSDDCYSDYQRLQRLSQLNQNTITEDDVERITDVSGSGFLGGNRNDNYVTNFMLTGKEAIPGNYESMKDGVTVSQHTDPAPNVDQTHDNATKSAKESLTTHEKESEEL